MVFSVDLSLSNHQKSPALLQKDTHHSLNPNHHQREMWSSHYFTFSVAIKTEVVSGRVTWLDMKSTLHLAPIGMLNHHCTSKYFDHCS